MKYKKWVLVTIVVCISTNIIAQNAAVVEIGNSVANIGHTEEGFYFGYISAVCSYGDTIFIVDRQNCEVVAASRTGKLHYRFGREGQGPGEFQMPRFAVCNNENIYVSDSRMRRIAVFSKSGIYRETISLNVMAYPDRMVIVNDHLYVAVRSVQHIIIKVDLLNLDVQQIVLSYDNAPFNDVELEKRAIYPTLNILSDILYIGLPNTGDIYALNPINDSIINNIHPENEITRSFWRGFRNRERKDREPGSIIPRVIFNIATWDDRYLLIQFNQEAGIPSTLFVIDPTTGDEAGPRIVSKSEGFYHHTMLQNGLLAWVVNAESMIYLFDMDSLQHHYTKDRE